MEVSVVSRSKQLLVSLLLLFLIAWIVNGLAATDKVAVPSYPFMIDLSNAVEPLQYFFFFAFLAILIGGLIMLIRDRRLLIEIMKAQMVPGKGERNRHNSMLTLIASILISGLFLMIILYVARPALNNLNPFASSENQQPYANPSESVPGTNMFNPPIWSYNLFVAPALLIPVILFAGCLMAVQALREMREESKGDSQESDEILEQKAFTAVKQAISTITNEGDFRTAIINCYQRLCELLAKHNCKIEDHQTAQEFETSALKALSIPESYFSTLTRLFEEARYSLHEIDQAKRNDALGCLTKIRDSLVGINQ
jgi:hypothetical protein